MKSGELIIPAPEMSEEHRLLERITELEAENRKLLQDGQRDRERLEALPQGVFLFEAAADGRITWTNRNVSLATGYPPEELLSPLILKVNPF